MSTHFAGISEVGRKLRSGETSSIAVTELMLNRIAKYNSELNAFITVTADLAREQASRADQELGKCQDRGPLHGIPIAVKDLIQTKEILTTCGSKLFSDWIPDKDATVVKKLREAGAVLLGKTGLHELAYGTSSINAFYGPIHNPWNLGYDPGGSSGGSAVAVAAGLCYAALGTDTGCSIRQPAHCCGIVGYKPTFGLVSKAGVFPLLWTMDHVGPLARSVQDAASVLQVIAGYDPSDPYSVHAPLDEPFDIEGLSLKGVKIGVVRRLFFDGYADVIDVVNEALEQLNRLGASLIELDIPDVENAFNAASATFAEAAAVHEENLAKRPQALSDELREALSFSASISAVEYMNAQHFRHGFTRRMEQLFSGCDALAAPTATIAASPIGERPVDYGKNAWRNTGIFDLTGQPSISIPCGFTETGLPVGLMLTGKLFDDRKVLQLAHAIEQATDWHEAKPDF